MKIKGKVTYIELEGGFWGIKGEDGNDYLPQGLPEKYKEEGMNVEAEVEPSNGFSLHMWGTAVKVNNIQKL